MQAQPAIIISQLDYDRIERLLENMDAHDTPAVARLRAELDRADIVEPADMPRDVISMNSSADCVDESSERKHTLTLVYPRDADAAAGKISVLASVGSALLGLRIGQSIDWPVSGGRSLRLKVTAIHYQPEAAGDLHR